MMTMIQLGTGYVEAITAVLHASHADYPPEEEITQQHRAPARPYLNTDGSATLGDPLTSLDKGNKESFSADVTCDVSSLFTQTGSLSLYLSPGSSTLTLFLL